MAICNCGSIPEIKTGKKNRIVLCKRCKKPEYWGKMRWLSGSCLCRDCYRSARERDTGKTYTWDDLDGQRPTEEEYNIQEKED